MSTLVLTDPRCLAHDPGPGHPESPARLRAILDLLARSPVAGVTQRAPRPATEAEIEAVHTVPHRARLAALGGEHIELDEDTAMSPGSYTAALLAAGAAVEAVESVMQGHVDNAFVLTRPPGHHAERAQAMGFCLFNNAAIAAEAGRRLGAERVLVLDWDVHHGNGTQHLFEARRDVLYASVHQFPFYPGTGAPQEIGTGEGAGYTVNVGLPGGQGDAEMGAVFHDVFLPVAEAFRPDLVVVSAGYDPHAFDPLGGLDLSERGFAAMTTALFDVARASAGGKLVLLLEGGYDLGALAASVRASLEVLAGARRDEFPTGAHGISPVLAATRAALAGHWRFG